MLSEKKIEEVILSQNETLRKIGLGIIREKREKINIINSFALIITGVRRCGKSTLLNQLLQKQKKGYYLNLEDPRLDEFDLSCFNKIEEIMERNFGKDGTYFFDEVQVVEKWEKFVRYLVDKKEKVVISGSNASLLSKELGTKLTGRHLQVELFPFSFNEFLILKKKKPSLSSFDEFLLKGGFPEYLNEENPEILQKLLSDIIMKDVAVRYGIKNVGFLNKIALFLVSNVGKEFSYNSIKTMFNIKSVQSVIDYISYIENTYILFTISRFSYSYKKQQVNPKKVYSIDNGLSYCNSLSFSKDKGKMLENLVFLELRRRFKNIYYFQKKNECDFVIKEKDKIILAVQVCFNLNDENSEREIFGLLVALKEFNLEKGLILTYNQIDEYLVEGKKIIVKPVWKWLLEKIKKI